MIRLTTGAALSLLDVIEALLPAVRGSTQEIPFREVRSILKEQLNANHHFDDLVDTIASAIQDPRITSLNKERLDLLRKSLLSPLELAKFKSTRSKKQSCVGCGRGLNDYESVTLRVGEIFCYQCFHPEVVTCVTCDQVIEVSGIQRTITRALQRHTCSAAQEAPPQIDVNHRPSSLNDYVLVAGLSEPASTASIRFRPSSAQTSASRHREDPESDGDGSNF